MTTALGDTTLGTPPGDALLPYVPRLVVEWLQGEPDTRRRSLPCTLVFADISGFTNLTEMLAERGKIGAEEMGDILNAIFGELLSAAYLYGAGLVKWGGDAVLLLFEGDGHAERAGRASVEMQKVIQSSGRLKTSRGPVRLRMSIGIHSGVTEFLLVGKQYRELIVTGPAATAVANAEKVADAGEIVITHDTAAALEAAGVTPVGRPKDTGILLEHRLAAVAETGIHTSQPSADLDLSQALPPALREHLLEGASDSEHRQVAVGFIQFSGTDALAADPDPRALTDALEALIGACQEAAAANDVTILSTDVNADGGKVIFISGAPRRVGDDELRVLTAVHAVLDNDSPLELRAGVNAGRVFAGDFGPAYRRNYSVAGDCVNLAARLMGAAGPGELLTTHPVFDKAASKFSSTPVPPFKVKGKSEPVHAVRVGAMQQERFQPANQALPLIGRDRELQVLRDALADAQRGDGRAVDLVGPAGIGKSRLLQEITTDADATVVWADGEVYGSAAPYQPIQRVVGELLGLPADAGQTEIGAALRQVVVEQAPTLEPWLPLIGLVVGVEYPMTPVVADIDPTARRERMEWSISELLGATFTTPTILVFNDAHLMDDATLDLVDRLVQDGQGRPWLIIITRRAAADAPDPDPPRRLRIELQPLDEAATNQMLAALTDASPLTPRALALMAERAGGNPLFLYELATGLDDADSLTELPDSIEGIVASRIDRLAPAKRRLLRSAAVVGMTMDTALLEEVLRADGVLHAHQQVELDGLDEFVERPDATHLRFRHHLVRQTAYEGLPYRRRMALHGAAADALEQSPGAADHVELLSLHCLEGGRHEAAWRYARAAADQARRRYANADATECFRRALSAADRLSTVPVDELVGVLESLGEAHFELGEFEEAEASLRRAHRLPDLEPEVVAELRLKIARCRANTGGHAVALRWLTKGHNALQFASSDRATRIHARISVNYARIRNYQGRYRDSTRWARRALEEAERCQDEPTKALALEYLGIAEAWLGLPTSVEHALRSLPIYEASGDLGGLGRGHSNLGMLYFHRGDWASAVRHYELGADAAGRAGHVWQAQLARANLAEVLSDQGRLDEAEAILEESVRIFRSLRYESLVVFCTYLLGRVDARSGRFDRARERLAAAREFCAEAGELAEVSLIDGLIAECHALAGEHDAALSLCDALLGGAGDGDGMEATVPLLHRVRASALVQAGRLDEARAAARDSLTAARARTALHEVALSLDALLDLGGATDADEASSWQAERDALFESLGIVPGHGWRASQPA